MLVRALEDRGRRFILWLLALARYWRWLASCLISSLVGKSKDPQLMRTGEFD